MTGTDASDDQKFRGMQKAVHVVECTLKSVHGSGLPNRSCE